MFTPPINIEAKLYASLPTEFRNTSDQNDWLSQHPKGMQTHSLLEGPVFDKNGNLYCSDVIWGRIFKIDSNGNFRLIKKYDGEPNGLKFSADGDLYIADFRHGILKLDLNSLEITPVVQRYRLEHFKAVNDLFFAKNGDLYFTDQGLTGLHDPTGRVYRLRPGGEIDCLLDNVPSPNGLVLDPQGDFLYVAATRANAIWRVPLMNDGGVAKVGAYIQLSGGIGPDGLAIDVDGRLIVAHFGLGSVWVFSSRGEPELRIIVPNGSKTTNITFGGKNNQYIYITEAENGNIYVAQMPAPGYSPY